MSDKPTVPEVMPFVKALYHRHGGGAGCCLHIVLDDGNVKDSSVQYCLDNAIHDDCRELATLLLRMSKTQRLKLSTTHYRA